MKVSLNLIKKVIDLDGLSPNELADRLTFAGVEVEDVSKTSEATNLVIGHVIECVRHPNSDHLSVTKVDAGPKHGILQIVCGAPNVGEKQKVIVALDGAVLPGGKITKGVIRGVESQGMICSLLELGVDAKFLSEAQQAGIEVLDDDAIVGDENVLAYLGLDDVILELKLLANRSDLHSLLNVAREISTLYGRQIRLPTISLPNSKEVKFNVDSLTPSCPQFSARVISNISVSPSPKWLKVALQSMGIRSINNIVDIGNYIMLLSGQPLHMYDLDKLPNRELIVKDDYEGVFRALDGKEYQLHKGDVVITSGGEVMCLGGVMGALSCAVDEKTKNVVIEVANFAFDAIRRTSTRLALVSDSSSRFVKGINPYQFEEVIDLATASIVDLCKTKNISQIITCDHRLVKAPAPIRTSVAYINKRLGTKFTQPEIVSTLTRDWCQVEVIDEDYIRVNVPTWRIDMSGEADISEEVIRIIGLDKINGVLPSLQVTVGGYAKDKKTALSLRRYLLGRGLDEVLTYSLVHKDELAGFGILSKGKPYHLINPLTDEHEYMRLGLMPSLLKVASYNLARGAKDLSFYEVSDVDSDSYSGSRLGLVLVGNDGYRHQLEKVPYSFYHLKGLLEGMMSLLGIKESRYSLEKVATDAKELHPGRSALLKVGGVLAGYLGELHPFAAEHHNLGKNKVFVMELDLGVLLSLETGQSVFKAFSRFPSVKRDLSLVADAKLESRKIVQTIISVDKLIKNVEIFDVYVGAGLLENQKSIALTVTYERDDRTLKDEEVIQVEKAVLELLKNKLGVTLRT
ncbi:MAG: phenylalanine--tRNA ligase subunit beta [Bacteroidia bacterium]|nr:phenylalanine--tRNA ligase subunit beta [Bacteroidia bacterium]